MCVGFVCQLASEVINFETNLIFLIKPFFYTTKKSRQKVKYIDNEKRFYDEIKNIFFIFKRLSLKQFIYFSAFCQFQDH